MQTETRRSSILSRTRVAAAVVWKAGLLLAAVGGFYSSFWWLFSLWAIPPMIMVAASLFAAGCAMVLLSLVLERFQDRRSEGDLLQ